MLRRSWQTERPASSTGGPLEHELFSGDLLADVEPTAPFGLLADGGTGWELGVASERLDPRLVLRIRSRCQRVGASVCGLVHLAWALVLSRVSGRSDVVFGTVLRSATSADSSLVPVRIAVGGQSAAHSLRETDALLARLVLHAAATPDPVERAGTLPPGTPLFAAVLDYRSSLPADQDGGAGHGPRRARPQLDYPVWLSVEDAADGVVLTGTIPERLSPSRLCALVRTALSNLVRVLDEDPHAAVGRLEVVPLEDRRLVLGQWNPAPAEYPRDRGVHTLFEERVERAPDAAAVLCGRRSETYRELNARANRLSRALVSRGVTAGDSVAIALERSAALVVAELAVLKAGGACVLLDTLLPGERQALIVADSGASVVITSRATHLPPEVEAARNVTRLHADDPSLDANAESNLGLGAGGEAPAYVTYACGATGAPVGVVVPHRAITRLVTNNQLVEFGPSDRVAFASGAPFDAATAEMWAPLLCGAAVVVIDDAVFLDPARLAAELRSRNVTVLWLTVDAFNQYASALGPVCGQLRSLIVGGGALDPRVVARVLRENPPGRLLSGYGLTESTTFALTHAVEPVAVEATSIPLGRPLGDARVYLLDEHQELSPVGATGEIYVGGDGLALGYLRQPARTAERFLPDPFADEPARRMYRTGDLGRWLRDGTIEFLGRKEFQRKIHGFPFVSDRREPQSAFANSKECCLHELFEARAERTPNAVAVVCGEDRASYRDLNSRANRLAWHLMTLGVKPGARVAVCMERSIELLVAILATLKAGGAYVPLDSGSPAERLSHVLRGSAAAAVLVDAAGRAALRHSADARLIDPALDANQWATQRWWNPAFVETGLTSRDPAYASYDSGSVGHPEGTMNEHRAVQNRIGWMKRLYGGSRDVVLQKAPFTLDVSVWEVFWPLSSGGRLVMAKPGGHDDPDYLTDVIRREGVSVVHFAPAMLELFLEAEQAPRCTTLARVFSTGAVLPPPLMKRFRERLPRVELLNLHARADT